MCLLDRHNSIMMLHVTNGLICTDFKLHRLRVCLSEYDIQAPKTVIELEVLGYFRPKLLVDWKNLKIINKDTWEAIIIANKFKILPY